MSSLFGRATQNLVLSAELKKAYEVVDRELKVVADIQRSLLPARSRAIPTLSVAAFYQTSQWAGGDYYDFFPLPDGKWGILIADVSGHGTPAAVLMAVTHSLAHGFPGPHDPPSALLTKVNHQLSTLYTADNEAFVTAFYGIYDPKTRRLDYSSAGHNPPRLMRCSQSTDRVARRRPAPAAGPVRRRGLRRFDPASSSPATSSPSTPTGSPRRSTADGRMFGTERLDAVLSRCGGDRPGPGRRRRRRRPSLHPRRAAGRRPDLARHDRLVSPDRAPPDSRTRARPVRIAIRRSRPIMRRRSGEVATRSSDDRRAAGRHGPSPTTPDRGPGGRPGGRAVWSRRVGGGPRGWARPEAGVGPAVGPAVAARPDPGGGGEPAGRQPRRGRRGPGEPDRRAPGRPPSRAARGTGSSPSPKGGRSACRPVGDRAGLALRVARPGRRGRGAGRRPDPRPGDRAADPPATSTSAPRRSRSPRPTPTSSPPASGPTRSSTPTSSASPTGRSPGPGPAARPSTTSTSPTRSTSPASGRPGPWSPAGPRRSCRPSSRTPSGSRSTTSTPSSSTSWPRGRPSGWPGRASPSWRRSPRSPEGRSSPCPAPTTSGWRSSARRPRSAWSRPRSSTRPTSGPSASCSG